MSIPVRDFSTGHRHSTTHHNPQQKTRKRPRNLPSMRNRTTSSRTHAHAHSQNDMLLDPLLGPLLMAKPDEAEYLLSRNPSMAMKRGSPYTQPKKSKRRRRSKRKYNHNRTNHRTNPHQKLKPLSHHSKSAPLLHQSSSLNAKQGIARLKSLHGGGNGKITITHGELDSNQTYGGGGAEFRVVQCILKREHQLRELQRKVSSSNTRPYFATDIIYMLLDLRAMAIDCIESIAEWRRPHSKTFDFCWEGQNYFKKMYQDSSFLKVCRPLGVCLGLPGIANNPLMEFDTASVNKAMSEYGLHKTWANALRINPTGSIDYDPVALEQEKKSKKNNLLSDKLKIPVMFTHAKHIVEDELKRLQLTHDVVNSKLVPTTEYLKKLHDAQEIKKRERMTLRKLQFELLKRRQAVRDRKGFETEQEEQQSMSPEEWSKKKKIENKEDQELLNKNKPKQDETSFSYRRNLLLKPKTREEMSQLEQEIKHLYDLLHRYEQDEQALEQKINRLELSLRSISQEGLLPQMMTGNDKVETKITVDQYRGGHLVKSGPTTGTGIGGATGGGTGDAIARRGSTSLGTTTTTTTTTTGSSNVLTKLLEESKMQDFVGGWRLKKLRLEYASCHERVVLLRNEMKVRSKDVVHQREKMDQVALAKQANKHKKERIRQKILAAKAERLAKGLKNMGVMSNTGSVGKKKKKKLTVAELEDGSSMIRTFEQEKRREEDNAIQLKDNLGHDKEKQEDLEHDTNSTTGSKVRFIRSNGVYPHESMLMAPQRRAKGQISGALPVLQHGGVYRTGVVNMGVFLSRKVVHPPPMTRKRSLVAQRSMLQDEEDKKESGGNKDVDDGDDRDDTLHSAIVEGGGVIVPIITSSSPKSVKALVASKNNRNASALKKYEPYSDRKRIEQEEQQRRKEQERQTTKKGNEDTTQTANKDAKKTRPTKRTKTDWFTNMVEKEEWLMPSGMPSLPNGEKTASSYSATSLPSSAASGLYSALSLPSAMNGINVLEPTTMRTRPTTISTTVTFSTSSRSPLVVMCGMLDVPRVVYLEHLLSKKISTVVQYLLQTKTPLMAIEQRKIQWIKPVLAEKADSAREALAFYRASLRTLQSLNPSDGDALFLAHISRDVAARRVVDALKLLSIDFGSNSGGSNGSSNKGGPTHLKKKKHRSNGNGQPKPEKNPLKMGWETVLDSLSDFDKTTVGPVVLKALKPLVRQLRLDIARRTENVNSDADIKPSLRAAKVIGAWLGSIVRWKDDYEGSLVQIEVLSKQKSLLEHAVTSVLGMTMREGR